MESGSPALRTVRPRDYGAAKPEETPSNPPTTLKTKDASLNDLIEAAGFGVFQWLYLSLFGLIYFSDAAELVLTAVILSAQKCEWNLTSLEAGLIPCVILLFYAVGSVIGGKLSDEYGRKRMLVIMLPILCIFSILSAFAPEYYSYLVFRSIVGFSIGSNTASALTFAMEIVPVNKRAFSIFIVNVWFVLGGFFVYLLGLFLMNKYGWRAIVLLTAVPTLISCLASCFVVESPRFLYVSGRTEEMERALRDMFHKNSEVMPGHGTLSHIEKDRGTLSEIFSGSYFRNSVLLTQVFTINAFISYGAILLLPNVFIYEYCAESSMFSSDNACSMSNAEYLYMLIIYSVSLPAVFAAYLASDWFGRLRTMFVSGFIVLIALVMMLICFGLYILMGEAAVVVFVSVLQNCALWTFLPESYPTYMRNAAVGFVNGFGKVGAALGSLVTEVVSAESIRACIIVYICLTVYQLICIFFIKKDTMGVRLEDRRNHTPSPTASP